MICMKDVGFLALDNMSLEAALSLTEKLRDGIDMVKINRLQYRYGPLAVHCLKQLGVKVWSDLKLHDTPDTVQGAASDLCEVGADFITVHGPGGHRMVAAAVEGAAGRAKIYGVTYLSSHEDEDARTIFGGTPDYVVLNFAKKVLMGGADGLICPPEHVARVAALLGGRKCDIVVPGARSAGVAHHDQKQVDTPANVFRHGATHFVVGRQVTAAADPVVALRALQEEIAGA